MRTAEEAIDSRTMPTYVYQREDGTTFEIEQRITADPLVHCPTTGQKVQRVISGGTGLIFKGSGFYLTDYGRGNGAASAASVPDRKDDGGSSGSSEPAESDSKSKPESSKESKAKD